MGNMHKIVAKRIRDSRRLNGHSITVAMIIYIAAVVFIATACQHKPVMAHADFKHMPSQGWQRTLPLCFMPEYDDSTGRYELLLAVRHDNTYPYRNLSLVVDIIAADSTIHRQAVDVTMADEYGNWTGGGFGTLYQKQVTLSRDIAPAAAHSVVVWQAMEGCDTLQGLVDMGITAVRR